MDQIEFIKTLYRRVNEEAKARGLEAQVSVAEDGLWISSCKKGHAQRKECLFWAELASTTRDDVFAEKLERSFVGAELLAKNA